MDRIAVALDTASLADQVYENLKLLILSGTLQGGERIPEEQVAQQFGVSRTPIREALKRLAEYGLVTVRPRSNAVVAQISNREAEDIARVRLALEKLAIESLDPSAIAPLIAALKGLAAECRRRFESGERAKAFEKDSEFHTTLVAGAGNIVLTETYERLDARIQLLRISQHLSSEQLVPYAGHHLELLERIAVGDTKATIALLETHIMHDFQS